MGRIALGIEYDGAAVYGWQRQREVPSVQEHLEKALSTVANEPIEVQCAGRTDAGVHATGQVVHFNCDAPRNERAWTLGVNANLPDSVAVTWAKVVPEDFHARFSAISREYEYRIVKHFSPITRNFTTPLQWEIDIKLLNECTDILLGDHDFTAFCKATAEVNHKVCSVHSACWEESGLELLCRWA